MSDAIIDTLIIVLISTFLIGLTVIVIVGAVSIAYGLIAELMDNISEREKRGEDRYE